MYNEKKNVCLFYMHLEYTHLVELTQRNIQVHLRIHDNDVVAHTTKYNHVYVRLHTSQNEEKIK